MLFRERQDDAKKATRLLVLLFFITLITTAWSATALINLVWQHGMSAIAVPRHFEAYVFVFAITLMIIGCLFQMYTLRAGGSEVARMLGGDEIRASNPKGHQVLLNIVDEMALAATMYPPRVFVIETDVINACAAGWTERDSVICVTTGAINKLTRDELQGVVAHELSHIAHEDCALNMRMSYLVAGLQFIYNSGWTLIQFNWSPDNSRHPLRSDRKASGVLILTLIGSALVVSGFIGWIGGRLIQAAISRQREYLADASAVQFTRLSDGIGGALRKISHQLKTMDHGMLVNENTGNMVNHMMLTNLSFKSSSWMDAHPPITTRIERIFGRVVGDLDSNAYENKINQEQEQIQQSEEKKDTHGI